jgi:hypothetical protein
MRKDDSKARIKLSTLAMRLTLALVLLGVLLAPMIAHADLKGLAVVYAWDIAALQYQNSNIVILFDGEWVPFFHELNFDNDEWIGACEGGGSTTWAGNMYYGVYHEDNAPLGAEGFRMTQHWELADCDRDGDDDFDNRDLAYMPAMSRTTLYPCMEGSEYCDLIEQDAVTDCTSGHCLTEIVTTFFVNLDPNCDGTPDFEIPPAGVCFYAEAQTPRPGPGDLFWSGPLMGRISTVGGDKTVSFSPQAEPTAIDLARFEARAEGAAIALEWETVSEVDNLGFNLYRAESQDGVPVQINDGIIPSQVLGAPLGAIYQFRDETALPGTTYYYWLEDVDIHGKSMYHGPVTAAYKLYDRTLPSRPRPIPAPIVQPIMGIPIPVTPGR